MAPPQWSPPASCPLPSLNTQDPRISLSRPLHSASDKSVICVFLFSPQLISKFLRGRVMFFQSSILQRAWHVTNSSSWGWVWQAVWTASAGLTLAKAALDAQWSQPCRKLLMGSSLWFMRARVAQAWPPFQPQFQVQESDPLTEVPSCTSWVLWATHWTSLLSWISYLQSMGSNSTWPGCWEDPTR